jgi:hypothetical protein
VYLVSGGGGAKPYPIARTASDLFQDETLANYHYVKFVSEQGMLKATMLRLDDKGGFEARDTFVVGAAAKTAGR